MTTKCPECGAEFQPQRSSAHFCSTACRKAFNNRRMTRGAELYDLFMAMRYARGWAKAQGIWQLVCRLAAEWRAEDDGAGRESFILPERWLQQNRAWLRGSTYHVTIGRHSKS